MLLVVMRIARLCFALLTLMAEEQSNYADVIVIVR